VISSQELQFDDAGDTLIIDDDNEPSIPTDSTSKASEPQDSPISITEHEKEPEPVQPTSPVEQSVPETPEDVQKEEVMENSHEEPVIPPEQSVASDNNAGEAEKNDIPPVEAKEEVKDVPAPLPIEHTRGIKGLITGICFLGCAMFIGLACYYRYQLIKYKIPPFTPPKFFPNFLFPRSFENGIKSTGKSAESYQMIHVNGYNPPEFNVL